VNRNIAKNRSGAAFDADDTKELLYAVPGGVSHSDRLALPSEAGANHRL
jgi:hypothetical protein